MTIEPVSNTTDAPAAEYATNIRIEELLGRAVRSGRRCRGASTGETRWARVMRIFALGSTSAQALCRVYGVDPDERVSKR